MNVKETKMLEEFLFGYQKMFYVLFILSEPLWEPCAKWTLLPPEFPSTAFFFFFLECNLTGGFPVPVSSLSCDTGRVGLYLSERLSVFEFASS